MFSPKGFVSIHELERRIVNQNGPNFSFESLRQNLIGEDGIYALTDNNEVTRITPDILATYLGCSELPRRCAFLNQANWTITFDLVRKFAVNESLLAGMYVLDGSLSHKVSFELPDTLLHLEGSPLFVSEMAAKSLLSGADVSKADQPMVTLDTDAEKEAAYKEFIQPFLDEGTKATKAQHIEWQYQNNISRDERRALKSQFAPESWKRPGRRKK